ITEVMYNPPGLPGVDNSKYEFIELRNNGATGLPLGGARLAGGIDFLFPTFTLGAGQFVIVARDQAAFNQRYGTLVGAQVLGPFTGELSNGGENILLKPPAPFEAAVLRFNYQDSWQPKTDGQSYSLVSVNPAAAASQWDNSSNWRASTV